MEAKGSIITQAEELIKIPVYNNNNITLTMDEIILSKLIFSPITRSPSVVTIAENKHNHVCI